jgi:hypothetical protein
LTNFNGMSIAGIVLAVVTCCGATQTSAQLFLNIGGQGMGSPSAQGSAGIGTANLGIGGFGSATEVQGLNEPVIGSNRGIGLPLLNQQASKPLGVTGNAAGSFSSAGDRPASPADSVTNTLMGPVSNVVSRSRNSAANLAGKRKQNSHPGSTSSSGRDAAMASKVSSAKSP